MLTVSGDFMKKILSVILAVVVAVCAFSGCSKSESKGDKLSIITTIFPYYDLVKQVAGDKADVTLLISPGAEPHDYEPTPKDREKEAMQNWRDKVARD